MGTNVPTTEHLNWDFLGLPRLELQHLDEPFTESELRSVIFGMPGDKALGHDGFNGGFYKKCWPVIKDDLLAALDQMHELRGCNWGLLNTANIALLPKKDVAAGAKDYRPISLIHSVSKVFSKLLANRLAPEIDKLVSHGQSAFIRGGAIQDNFLYVKNIIRIAHRKRIPTVFLKLDLAKAFDSVNWGFLLEVLNRMGFGQKWRDMIAIFLASSSSRVLLNGSPGSPFLHRRGLRQGDPLSPLLFILVLEPLQKLLQLATDDGILSPLSVQAARLRASFYADDAAVFINPVGTDLVAVQRLLRLFGDASGLRTNVEKCVAYPISCQWLNMEQILAGFGGSSDVFPCKYLGLPLDFRKPSRAELQPILDKIAGSLKVWKGKLMDRASRLRLVNSVITSMAAYHLAAFPADKWFIKKVDKLRRGFLWSAEEEAKGGQCLVNWKRICAPKNLWRAGY